LVKFSLSAGVPLFNAPIPGEGKRVAKLTTMKSGIKKKNIAQLYDVKIFPFSTT